MKLPEMKLPDMSKIKSLFKEENGENIEASNKTPEEAEAERKAKEAAKYAEAEKRKAERDAKKAAREAEKAEKAAAAEEKRLMQQEQAAAEKPKTASKPASKSASAKKNKKQTKIVEAPLIIRILHTIITVVLTTFLSFALFLCVTGIICAIAATTYVMDYMESTTTVSIQELTTSFKTQIFANNADGEEVEIYSVDNEVERIPVEIEDVPQHVRNAFVYGEDKHFYTHEGVDYKRTVASFANMLFSFWGNDQGGSTITQQLVKNLTGDDERSPQRKIREIFRALQLEKSYSKDEILINYINYIGFGGAANGVELAANKYFGKSVKDLSIAEAACLAAIPQSPEKNNPFAGENIRKFNEVTQTYYISDEIDNTGRKLNRDRMEYILGEMYDNGAITYDEYQEALAEKLLFTDTEEYKLLHPETEETKKAAKKSKDTSWVIDEALREFRDILMDERGVSQNRAMTLIKTGGYKIYTTVDWAMQEYVEKQFMDLNTILKGMSTSQRTFFPRDMNGDKVVENGEGMNLECGFTAIDYHGNVLCTVGKIGGHTDPLGISYASTEKQQPGSAIKPVSTYGYALEHDYITYATKVLDDACLTFNGKPWPTNYSEDNSLHVSRSMITVEKAIEQSYNTIPALITKTFTPQKIYEFANETLGLGLYSDKDATDMDYAPLSVGALSYGITVKDLVNAFMVYGNGGYFSDAHIISSIKTAEGEIYYTGGDDYAQVIGEDTAVVMNHLLQNVVDNGTASKLSITTSKGKAVPLAGKTGTSSDWIDKLFVGLNPDFVSGIWIGYPLNEKIKGYNNMYTPNIWKNIIGGWIAAHYSGNDFPSSDEVVSGKYCTVTGRMAGAGCGHAKSATTGYWKKKNCPVCNGNSSVLKMVTKVDE